MANEIAITEGKPSFKDNQVFQVFKDEFLQKCKDVVNLIKATSTIYITTNLDEINQLLNNLKFA